jgi:membrane-associated phospholipid phosphatase
MFGGACQRSAELAQRPANLTGGGCMSVIRKGRPKTRSVLACVLSGVALLACSEQTPLESPGVDVAPQFHHSTFPPAPPATLGWQALARSLVGTNNVGPVPAARVYALLSLAQYGAINDRNEDDDGNRSNHGYGRAGRRRVEFERGAVAGASWVVLAFIFPNSAAALEQRVHDEEAAAGTPHFSRGIEAGKRMGDRLVEWAKADRSTAPFTGTIPVGPGKWTSSGAPLVAPTFGGVAPYFLRSASQFRPLPPPAFNAPAFLADLAEIRLLSDTRTPEQLAIAQFWSLQAGTPTPPGYWNQVASDFIEQHGLNEREATHVFALMDAAMVDAAIGCWDAKFFYWYIRPSQADAAITLPIGLPNHPSFPSGHSCLSSAATTVLAHFFPKHAKDLQNQLEQAGLSRMYGGIHYRFDIDAGKELGKSVGKYAIRFDKRKGLVFRIP